MEQETFNKIIEIWKRAEQESTPASPPGKTEDCLSFMQFEEYSKAKGRHASDEQQRHVKSCSYCQRMVRLFKEQTKPNPIAVLGEKIVGAAREVIHFSSHVFRRIVRGPAIIFETLREFISLISFAFERIILTTPIWKLIPGLTKLAARARRAQFN